MKNGDNHSTYPSDSMASEIILYSATERLYISGPIYILGTPVIRKNDLQVLLEAQVGLGDLLVQGLPETQADRH